MYHTYNLNQFFLVHYLFVPFLKTSIPCIFRKTDFVVIDYKSSESLMIFNIYCKNNDLAGLFVIFSMMNRIFSREIKSGAENYDNFYE